MDASIVIYPGVRALEASAALAAFRAAELDAEWVGPDALVTSLEGARLVPHRLGIVTDAKALVLPGGDVSQILRDVELARVLRARRGQPLLLGGEALRVAAAAGLLEGAHVAVAPGEPTPPGAQRAPARLARDGRLLSCFGGDAMMDLALHHVAHEHGEDLARKAAGSLGRDFATFAMGANS